MKRPASVISAKLLTLFLVYYKQHCISLKDWTDQVARSARIKHYYISCVISGFRCSVVEAFALARNLRLVGW
jgi:hypothetical protein